ncbi:hypothetical protein Tco_0900263 [Tanacetum coccineum]
MKSNESSRSQVNSGPLLEFQRTLTNGIRLRFNRLISRSMISTDADHADCQDTRRSTSSSMQLLCDRLVSWSSKKQKITAAMALDSTKFLCTTITKVILLYVVTTSNTQDPSISTSDIISSKSKWKMVWLNSTSMSPKTLKRLAEEAEE